MDDEAFVSYSDAWSEFSSVDRGYVTTARISLNARSIKGRMNVKCVIHDHQEEEEMNDDVQDQMTVVVECEYQVLPEQTSSLLSFFQFLTK